MSTLEKLLGVSVVCGAFFMTLGSALNMLAKHPNWLGITLAACACITGCFIITSIVRDRL